MAISGLALADPIIKLVEKQVKDQGGILGGREVKVVRYDNRGSVAEAAAGAAKLLIDEKVSTLVFGGVSSTEAAAVVDFAEKNQILFVAYGTVEKLAEKKYTLSATWDGRVQFVGAYVDVALKVIKPKTVGFLGSDLEDTHIRVQRCKEALEAAGIKTVYEQYAAPGTSDYSAYLTKIKYENPGMLVLDYVPSEPFLTIGKQIMELGGWGDIKVVCLPGAETAKRLPGVQGMYILIPSLPGNPYPGAVKFETDYKAMNKGTLPNVNQAYFYCCLWTAIYAIELAGTDTDLVKIAEAARSGKLEWDTPLGHAHYTLEGGGYPGLAPKIAIVEEGKLVPVTIPD